MDPNSALCGTHTGLPLEQAIYIYCTYYQCKHYEANNASYANM